MVTGAVVCARHQQVPVNTHDQKRRKHDRERQHAQTGQTLHKNVDKAPAIVVEIDPGKKHVKVLGKHNHVRVFIVNLNLAPI
jgi:uncharacterized Zn finger protein (UPF0148 family)